MNALKLDVAKIRIIIVTRLPIVEQSLKIYWETEEDLEISGYAENTKKALQLIEIVRPDIAIVDIDLPDREGFSIIKMLRSRSQKTKIIALSDRHEQQYVSEAIATGVKGYFLKETPPQDLASAIRNIHQGYFQLSADLLKRSRVYSRELAFNEKFTTLLDRASQDIQDRCQTKLDRAIERHQIYVNEKIELKLHSLKLKQADTESELKKIRNNLVKLLFSQIIVIAIALISLFLS
jgi:DNA-binding NarL/FixJ family response regulator